MITNNKHNIHTPVDKNYFIPLQGLALHSESLAETLSPLVFSKTPLQCFTAQGTAPQASETAATMSFSRMRGEYTTVPPPHKTTGSKEIHNQYKKQQNTKKYKNKRNI